MILKWNDIIGRSGAPLLLRVRPESGTLQIGICDAVIKKLGWAVGTPVTISFETEARRIILEKVTQGVLLAYANKKSPYRLWAKFKTGKSKFDSLLEQFPMRSQEWEQAEITEENKLILVVGE